MNRDSMETLATSQRKMSKKMSTIKKGLASAFLIASGLSMGIENAFAQFNGDDPLTINSVNVSKRTIGKVGELSNLGQTLASQGRLREAEDTFNKGIELSKTEPANPIDLANCHNNLGLLYMNTGRFADAESHFNTALPLCENDKTIVLPGIVCDNLGQTYRMQKQYDKAEPLYQKALAIESATVGKGSEDYATTEVNLALLHIAKRNLQAADTLLNDSLRIFAKAYGPDSPPCKQVASYLEIVAQEKRRAK